VTSKNKCILAAAVLSVLSTGVNAKIYPDQIVRDQKGEDVCRSGYRPLDRYESEGHKSSLLQLNGYLGYCGPERQLGDYGSGFSRFDQAGCSER